jgi:hypothetical protein
VKHASATFAPADTQGRQGRQGLQGLQGSQDSQGSQGSQGSQAQPDHKKQLEPRMVARPRDCQTDLSSPLQSSTAL